MKTHFCTEGSIPVHSVATENITFASWLKIMVACANTTQTDDGIVCMCGLRGTECQMPGITGHRTKRNRCRGGVPTMSWRSHHFLYTFDAFREKSFYFTKQGLVSCILSALSEFSNNSLKNKNNFIFCVGI